MTEMQEFYRFKRNAGDYATVKAIKDWWSMPPEDKDSLRKKWSEDE